MTEVNGMGRVLAGEEVPEVLNDDVGVVVTLQEPISVVDMFSVYVIEYSDYLVGQVFTANTSVNLIDIEWLIKYISFFIEQLATIQKYNAIQRMTLKSPLERQVFVGELYTVSEHYTTVCKHTKTTISMEKDSAGLL